MMRTRVLTHVVALVLLVVTACVAEDTTAPSTTRQPEASETTTGTAEPSTSTDTASPSTPTALPQSAILRGDGLDGVRIGDTEDEAITALVQLYGQPTSDIINKAASTEESVCSPTSGLPCFNYLRFAEWDSLGLVVIIGDWTAAAGTEFEILEAPPNLRGYVYTGGAPQQTLGTAEGITIGSTLEDLMAAYGDDLVVTEDPCAFDTEYGFTLRGATESSGLRGQLSREPVKGLVESIGAGDSWSNC